MVYNESKGGWLTTVVQIVAWAVATLGTIVDMLAVREVILSILAVFRVIEQQAYHARGGVGEDIFTALGLTAVDTVSVLFIGIGAIVAVIGIEYYFRRGRARGLLYKRIGKVALIEVAIVVAAIIIRTVMGLILTANGG